MGYKEPHAYQDVHERVQEQDLLEQPLAKRQETGRQGDSGVDIRGEADSS
jgi:hypothetical protein